MKKRYLTILFLVLLVVFTYGSSKKIVLNSSAFNGLKAREIGPAVMGGRITAIAGVNGNPDTLYVGAAGGGLWKTLNGGTSFTPVFDEWTMSIGSIAIDQKNPKTVWVGTGETNMRNTVSIGTGLYKTEDGGRIWQKIKGFENSERIAKIIVHPGNSKIVYVAVAGHLWNDSKDRGLYKTADGGKTWKKILYVDEKTGCIDMDIDPQRPSVIYAAMWQFRRKPYFFTSGGKGSNLYRSEDGGKTWKMIRKGLPKGELGRISITIAPSRPGTIYANVEASKKSGLYVSYDMGENWKFKNDSMFITMRPFYFSRFVVDPKNFRRLYFTGLMLSTSTNGGKTLSFPFSFKGGIHPDIHAIWINPNNTKQVFVGCDGGVYRSNNYGKQFEFLSNLPVSQFYHVDYDLESPYNVYGGLQDNGSWYGPSKSYNRGIQNKEWINVGGGDGFYVIPHPKDSDIIYYSWQGGEFMRYNRRTKETKSIKPLPTKKGEPKYRFNWNAGIALSPGDSDTIYIGAQFLFKSTNRGDKWVKISPDLTTNNPEKLQQARSGGLTKDNTTAENHCSIVTISESPLNKNLIWVGTDDGNLQITRDGGENWENVVKNIKGLPPNTWCSSVETSRFSEGRAYVTFDGHRTGDMNTFVYTTDDYGKTWKFLTTDSIKGYSHIIREDLKNKNLLFLGTEFGLYISIDRGENWAKVKSVPNVGVRDIKIHPKTNDIILATHGRGIMIIDDITPLRALNSDILNAAAFVLPSRVSYMSTPTSFQEFPGDGEFFGQNPPEGAMITYYLKKRHIFGTLKIQVLDKNGKIIQEFPGTKSKGINRIYWGMRLKAPKAGNAPGLSPMISQGPMVAEGEYTIKLIKNKKTFEGKIKLLPDPKEAHTKEERAVRHKAVMKLYGMLENLGFIADNTGSLIKQIKEIEKKKKYKKLAQYKKELTGFHKSMVQYGGLMTEPKLRGEVLGLYSSIMMYGGKPTDSQLHNIDVLKFKIDNAKKRYKMLMNKLNSINNYLKKKHIKELKIMEIKKYKEKK